MLVHLRGQRDHVEGCGEDRAGRWVDAPKCGHRLLAEWLDGPLLPSDFQEHQRFTERREALMRGEVPA